jgi:hypothetical protein
MMVSDNTFPVQNQPGYLPVIDQIRRERQYIPMCYSVHFDSQCECSVYTDSQEQAHMREHTHACAPPHHTHPPTHAPMGESESIYKIFT